jgi:hypothetical protein
VDNVKKYNFFGSKKTKTRGRKGGEKKQKEKASKMEYPKEPSKVMRLQKK